VTLSTAPAAALPASAAPAAPKGHDWRNEVFYFPLTDRFADGDPTNNQGVNKADIGAFHGGDLKGLISKLDYIQSLGATTLWLSPLQDNTNDATIGTYNGHGYHGYWIRDHYAVEEHQGDMALAKELVKQAQSRGMKVVLDVVLNHTGPDHPLALDPSKRDWFNQYGGIQDYNDQWWVENGMLGGLPDLNQAHEPTYQFLLDNTVHWVKELGVDGVRLDAVKHIPKDYWTRFTRDLKENLNKPDFFILGEVLHGDPNYVAPYQKAGIDYLFDMPLYYTITEVFGKGDSARKLGERLAQDSIYQDPDKLVTLVDNHDYPRFIYNANGDPEEKVARLKQALTFLMTVRGTPSLYYGTETAMDGGPDPDNRRSMEFDRRPDVKAHLTGLTALRAAHEPLRTGIQREMWQDDQVYAFSRQTDDAEAIAVFNTSGSEQQRSMPLRGESELANGTRLKDLLSGQVVTVRDGRIDLKLGARQSAVLVKE